MTCHLINKAVMRQNCIEALNQHAQPLEKSCLLEFHLQLRQSVDCLYYYLHPLVTIRV